MAKEQVTAKQLQQLWGISAQHVLYFKDGNWYHNLKTFPGALFDPNGYILFNTIEEYITSPYLNIDWEKNQLHIPAGISRMPGYVRFSQNSEFSKISARVLTKSEEMKPKRAVQVISRIERDTPLVRYIKALYECKCQICGITITICDPDQVYAEVHHIVPLGTPHDGPDVLENMLCVCPNHHVQLDYGAIALERRNLTLHPSHLLHDEYLNYHNHHIWYGKK